MLWRLLEECDKGAQSSWEELLALLRRRGLNGGLVSLVLDKTKVFPKHRHIVAINTARGLQLRSFPTQEKARFWEAQQQRECFIVGDTLFQAKRATFDRTMDQDLEDWKNRAEKAEDQLRRYQERPSSEELDPILEGFKDSSA